MPGHFFTAGAGFAVHIVSEMQILAETSINRKEVEVSKLTPRQTEIERMVGEGWGTTQIAAELTITVGAARAVLARIFKKRGVANTHELAVSYWKRKTSHLLRAGNSSIDSAASVAHK